MNRLVASGELRLGLRLIAKQPILSATIILALATGIGLATMGFTLREALVHSTLPYQAGDRFVRLNVIDLQLQYLMPLEDADRDERTFLAGVASALTVMGGMALLLSIVGIYALLSFMVTRRTREIGIRVALGAARWQVLRSITGGAAVYLAVGGLLGSLLGIAFVQMRSLILISIPAPGFWMPATIFATLATAGVVACWLPARRALGIRPAEALSAD